MSVKLKSRSEDSEGSSGEEISFRLFARLVWMITMTYNINADDAACALQKQSMQKNWYSLTDIEGVFKDPGDPSTLISELHVDEAKN